MVGGARPTPFLAIGQTKRKGNGGCYTENKKNTGKGRAFVCVCVRVHSRLELGRRRSRNGATRIKH